MPILSVRLPTSGDSSSSSESKTITIPNLGKIKNVTVDTGNVTYELLNDEQVKINVSGGSYVRRKYSSTKYSKYVTGQISSNYDKDGYTGTLTRYLYSGSYTPADSKTATATRSVYTYTIVRWNGNSWEDAGEYDSTPSSINYNSGGYFGPLSFTNWSNQTFNYHEMPINPSVGTTCKDIEVRGTAHYSGTVTRQASDTRVYRYKGTVYKGGYNYYYAYNVTIEYEEDSTTYLKINNEYKKVHFYLKQNGIYVKASPCLKVNNEYKRI